MKANVFCFARGAHGRPSKCLWAVENVSGIRERNQSIMLYYGAGMGQGIGWQRAANGREYKYIRTWKHNPYSKDDEDANPLPAPLQTNCFPLHHKWLPAVKWKKHFPAHTLSARGFAPLTPPCLVRFSPWRGSHDTTSLLLILPTFPQLSSPFSLGIRDPHHSIPRPVFFPNVPFLGDCA